MEESMKTYKVLLPLIFGLVFLVSQPASSTTLGFNGAYAVNNWVWAAPANGGSVDTTGAPNWIKLKSSWDNNWASWELATYQLTAPEDAVISFHWDYNTTDGGGSVWDRFGWVINGSYSQLTYCAPCGKGNANNNNHIWGDTSISVLAGDSFGFYFYSDGFYGTATSVVSAFVATTQESPEPSPVPEPSTLVLFGIGALGTARIIRKKSS